MNKMKKTSAALMAAAVLAVAAPMTAVMTGITAYAAETTENGITIKTDAKFAQDLDTLEDCYYYNDWRNTFEITASADAFKDGSTCEVRLSYIVSDKNGMDAVAEISWDCDAIIDHTGFSHGVYYNPETNLSSNMIKGGHSVYYSLEALDGDIAPCLFNSNSGIMPIDGDSLNGASWNEFEWEEILMTKFSEIQGWSELEYHLGSKNGVDYLGAGKGVYVPPRFKATEFSEFEYSYTVNCFHIIFNEPGTITLTMKDRTAFTEPTTPTDPTIDTKEQSFHDETNDIIVEGNFPEGTVLKTKVEQTSDTKISWDITLVDANGNKVQPNGTATVKVPLPEAFKGKSVYVYSVENGKYTAYESNIEGDYIVFKTNHFSEYMLTTEKIEEKPASNPNTGISAAAALGVIAMAGAFVVVSRKKR